MTTRTWNDRVARLPRAELRLGSRVVPVYLVAAVAGIVAGALVMTPLAAAAGLPVVVTPVLGVFGLAGFLAFAFLRRALGGTERHVLLEQFVIALGVAGGVAALAGWPWRTTLDVYAVGLAVLLAWGRVGCLVGGCCFGVPTHGAGLRYPRECGAAHGPVRVPVQALEAAVWAWLAATGAVLTLVAAPGTALAATLAGYAIARIALESLRGDARPHWAGLSEARWLCLLLLVVGAGLARPLGLAESVLATAAGAAALGLWLAHRRWLAPDESGAADSALRELGRRWRDESPGARVVSEAVGELVVAVSAVDARRWCLSVSRAGRALSHAAACRALEQVLEGLLPAGEAPPAFELRPDVTPRGVHAVLVAAPRPARGLSSSGAATGSNGVERGGPADGQAAAPAPVAPEPRASAPEPSEPSERSSVAPAPAPSTVPAPDRARYWARD